MSSWIAPDMFGPKDHRPWPFGALAPLAYDQIMADPPWHFDLYSDLGDEKSPQAQYDTMSIDEICSLPVSDLAKPDCMLLMWATAPLLHKQIPVMKAWGFEYKSAGVWNKRRIGPGYIWRGKVEFMLVGTRGAPKINGKSVPNYIEETSREHSRKPDGAYAMCERMMPEASRCSLFERTVREGWDGWGNQYGQPISGKKAKAIRAEHSAGGLFEIGATPDGHE